MRATTELSVAMCADVFCERSAGDVIVPSSQELSADLLFMVTRYCFLYTLLSTSLVMPTCMLVCW